MSQLPQRSTGGGPRRPQRLFSIGEVLAQLRPEFSDLTHSKVRFLEDQGLVEPERTAAGYRKFSTDDVERLRFVLSTQRDYHWPLKEIGSYLDAADRGLDPAPPGGVPTAPRLVGNSTSPGPDGFVPASGARMRREELVASAGIDDALLASLETFGLVSVGDQGFYDADDLEIARTAGELAGFGIEPRHLRAFRTAADREVGLVEQVTTPLRHHRGAGASAKAEEVAREISALCVRLHATLVRSGLDRLG